MDDGQRLHEVVGDVSETPVMVVFLDGFIDAGHAGGGFVEHVLNSLDHEVVARFDADSLVDYRARRPPMLYSGGRFETYEAPELTLYRVSDDGGSPFLLLTGFEPDVRWEAFVESVIELIDTFGVRLTVNVHGIPNPVPHTRPIGVLSYTSRPDLLPPQPELDADIRVPGTAMSLLAYRLGRSGRDAAGFLARVPHYLAEADFPQAALALLRAVSSATGLLLPTEALLEASDVTDRLVSEQVAANEQVAKVVRALESQYDAFTGGETRGSLIAEQRAIPSADEIGAELEQFLAEIDDSETD
jgi:hypothetical protein